MYVGCFADLCVQLDFVTHESAEETNARETESKSWISKSELLWNIGLSYSQNM